MVDTTGMTKSQRIEAATKMFRTLDEYESGAVISAFMIDYDLSLAEAKSIVFPPQAKAKPIRPVNEPCHYCGLPAVKYGSFDEPVCNDCK